MAWGATLFKVPQGVTKLDELPEDYRPPPIGTTEEIYTALCGLFPGHEHKPGETSFCDGCSWIELHYDYQKTGFADTIGVRSNGGATAFAVLRDVCATFGLSLFDNQTGELSGFDDSLRASFAEFQAFKKSVIG